MSDTQLEIADRRSPTRRANVMFAAILRSGDEELAVRVRNLSEMGALVEASTLPAPDTAVSLVRNNLSVNGSVVWSSRGRAGLRFAGVIDPSIWIKPGQSAPAAAPDQARVDAIQAAARAGLPTLPVRPLADTARASLEAVMPTRIVEELAFVRRLVESIGDELVGEPAVVSRHPAALQKFDLAGQILGQLGAVLLADDPVAAAEKIGQQELRARLLRRA